MKIKYFDKAIEGLFLALLFLLPVIFDRRIGIVFSGTKSTTIRLFLLAILTIWAIKLLVGGRSNIKRSILDWPILSYLLAATAATITSVNTIISIFGFYGRYEGLVTWYCYALMFFITANYFKGFDKIKQLAAIIIPASATMAVYGILQRSSLDPYVWGGVVTNWRVIATIGQPNFLSAFMDMSFFLMIFFLLTSNSEKEIGILERIQNNIRSKAGKIINKPQPPITDWNKFFQKLMPIIYFVLTPILFIAMIYTQTGQNIIAWYFFFAAMAVSALLFSFTYQRLPNQILKFIAGISLVLIYICNFYTQSRGGFIGLGIGIVLFIVLVPRKRILENCKILGIFGLAILLITIITSLNPDTSPFVRFGQEIKSSGTEQQLQPGAKDSQSSVELGGAAGSRGETWKSAAGIISDNPFWGIGPEDLKMVFPRYETNLFRFKEAFHVKQDRCHNETFDIPVTKGLIAFFIYISIIIIIFRSGLQKLKSVDDDKKVLIAVVLAAIASYIFQNQFSFGVIAITSLFWVLWGILANIDSKSDEEENKNISLEDVPWLPVGLIIIAFLSLGFVSVQQFEADKQFKIGKTYLDMRRFSDAIPYFKSSLNWFPFEGGTTTHYGIAQLNNAMQSPPQEQRKNLDAALAAFDYGIKVDPFNADNLYISSRIFLMTGDFAKALEYSKKTLKTDPYYAEAYLTLAAIAEKNGNAAEVQKAYNEAYRINPNLSESKIKVAESLLAQKKFDDAFNIFQDMLTTDPKNPAVHNGLGTIYLQRNDKERAREEFEQTLSIDPNNAYAKMMLNK